MHSVIGGLILCSVWRPTHQGAGSLQHSCANHAFSDWRSYFVQCLETHTPGSWLTAAQLHQPCLCYSQGQAAPKEHQLSASPNQCHIQINVTNGCLGTLLPSFLDAHAAECLSKPEANIRHLPQKFTL
eukprot:1146374-Pelagomonas_calceolata.AAC.1